MKQLILMIQFLTRIPLPITLDVTNEDFTKGFKYFPVVGSIIGGLIYAIHFILRGHISSFTMAIVIVLSYLYITGGLHMDGLSDSADGLFSGRSKERVLEIMKDSRIGSNGALAMVFVILLKIAFMTEVAGNELGLVLLVMPMISKYNVVLITSISKYARPEGMGNWFIGKVKFSEFLFSTLFTLGLLLLINPAYLFIVLGCGVFGLGFRRFCYKQIDGLTGDTIGALSELSDVAVLVFACILF